MFNWIKNLFSSSPATVVETPAEAQVPVLEPVAEPAVQLDTTANWPFPTSNRPPANDPAPVVKATAKPKSTKPKTTAKPKAEPKKKAAPKTASKKPAAVNAAEPKKRGRKPKSEAGA